MGTDLRRQPYFGLGATRLRGAMPACLRRCKRADNLLYALKVLPVRRNMRGALKFAAGLLCLPVIACGSRVIRKEEIQRISKDYEGVYVLRNQIDTGNFDSLNKGARVKIFFKAASDYVSVYAYPYSQAREEAVGKNILQLFEGDFPDKKFDEQLLRARLAELLEEYKGKPEVPAKPGKAAKKAGR